MRILLSVSGRSSRRPRCALSRPRGVWRSSRAINRRRRAVRQHVDYRCGTARAPTTWQTGRGPTKLNSQNQILGTKLWSERKALYSLSKIIILNCFTLHWLYKSNLNKAITPYFLFPIGLCSGMVLLSSKNILLLKSCSECVFPLNFSKFDLKMLH